LLQSLELQNFQSHKKTNIQFSSGINSIVGISDSGKTALLRGLNWAINNRPLGLSYISHWNRDKDGEPIKSTFVRVTTDKGIIERRKGKVKVDNESKKFNGYIINEKDRLEAVGTSVPDSVNKMFNLDEVNFQGQFDPSFLLSNSAGEVARFFNATIRLDLIDRILSKAESKRLDTNKEKKQLEIEQDSINKEIVKFDWIEDAEILIDKIIKLDSKIENNNHIFWQLTADMDDWIDACKEIEKYEIILSAVPIVKKIDLIQESLEEKIEKYERLQNLYDQYLEQNRIIGTADFSIANELIEKIEVINNRIENNEKEYELLNNSLDEYQSKICIIESCNFDINKLGKQLPTICPTCGKRLSEDKCK
jgi:exonuclease SbcC